QHGPVLRQYLGHETGDAGLPGRLREVLEQGRADAAALVRVLDDERDLGVGRVHAQPLVPAYGDEVVAQRRHQCLPVGVVDVDGPFEVTRGDTGVRGEVAQVAGPVGEAGVQRYHQVGVVRRDWSHVDGRSVGQEHVDGAHGVSPAGRTGRARAGGRPPAGWRG